MKKSNLFGLAGFLAVVVLASMTFVISACASKTVTPRQSYSSMNDTFITAVSVLKEASDVGALSQKDLIAVTPFVIATDKLLDAYDAATKAGLDGATILDQIKAALIEIAPYVDKVTAKGAKPNVGSSVSPSRSRSPGSGGQARDSEYEVSGRTRSVYRAAEQCPSQARYGSRAFGRATGACIAA